LRLEAIKFVVVSPVLFHPSKAYLKRAKYVKELQIINARHGSTPLYLTKGSIHQDLGWHVYKISFFANFTFLYEIWASYLWS